jgi:hypothetical protein
VRKTRGPSGATSPAASLDIYHLAWPEITDSISIAVRSSPATPWNAVKNVGTRGLGEITGPRSRREVPAERGSKGAGAVWRCLHCSRLVSSLLTLRLARQCRLASARADLAYAAISHTHRNRSRGVPPLVLGPFSPAFTAMISRHDTAACCCTACAARSHHSSTLLSAQSLQDPRHLSRCSPAREHSTEFNPPWHSSRPSAR